MEKNWRTAARRRAILPLAVILAGLAVVLLSGDAVTDAIGWSVVGLGALLATVLVFLEVGYSEDRARAAERRRPT